MPVTRSQRKNNHDIAGGPYKTATGKVQREVSNITSPAHTPSIDKQIQVGLTMNSTPRTHTERLVAFNQDTVLGKLPAEIVQRISAFASEEGNFHTFLNSFVRPSPKFPPLSLTSTCKWALETVSPDASAWTRLSGTQHDQGSPNPQLIKLWLNRTKGLYPLHLHMSPPLIECIHHGEVRCDEEKFSENIMRQFMKRSANWEGIAFDLDNRLTPIYLEAFTNTGSNHSPAPGLKKLELDTLECTNDNQVRQVFDTIRNFRDSLEELSWGGPVGFSPTVATPIHLPKLEILHIKSGNATGVREVVGCLNSLQAPSLRQLYLDWPGSGFGGPNWHQDTERLVSALQTLDIDLDGIMLLCSQPHPDTLYPLVAALETFGRVGTLRVSPNRILDSDTGEELPLLDEEVWQTSYLSSVSRRVYRPSELRGLSRDIAMDFSDSFVTFDYTRR